MQNVNAGLPSTRAKGASLGPRVQTLTYKSRAVSRFSEDELGKILSQARSRNRLANVTGILLYDSNRFFQWLEGPAESIDPIWRSIKSDQRHTDVDLISREYSGYRLFSDWEMRLVSPGNLFETVSRQTEAARSLPPGLVKLTARLALEGNSELLRAGIAETLSMGVELPRVYSGLIEPAARLLGDLWQEDACCDEDISLALGTLRSVVREFSESNLAASTYTSEPIRVLLVTLPGEQHILGVSLANDLYRQSNFNVFIDFPSSYDDIGQVLSCQSFDVLTISMSDVFSRFEGMEELASDLDDLRRQSMNPDLVVVIGGRAFCEKPSLMGQVRADAVFTSLSDLVTVTQAAVLNKSGC